MATGLTLITDAFLELGIGAHGESLSADLSAHGLRKLNRMWSAWSAELRPIYASTLVSHTWPASTASQTIASASADITAARPINILGMQVRSGSVDYDISPISYEAYEKTPYKSETATTPIVYAYKGEYPKGIIYIYPMLSSALTVRITTNAPLTAFTLAGTVSLPDGYEEALVSNLAINLAPAYGRTASPETIAAAQKAKRAITLLNDAPMEMWPDGRTPGLYNRYSTGINYNG